MKLFTLITVGLTCYLPVASLALPASSDPVDNTQRAIVHNQNTWEFVEPTA